MPNPLRKHKHQANSKKQRKGETNASFVRRVQKSFPKVILEMNANIEATTLVYGIELKLLKAFVAKDPAKKCTKAYTRARAIAAAEMSDDREHAKMLRNVAAGEYNEEDTRLKRKRWPTDEDEREASIRDALMISLLENHGDVVEAAKCLSLDTYDIMELLETDAELQEQKDRGIQVAVLHAEAMLVAQAKAGNVTAIKSILSNLAGDTWSERQNISIRHEGFKPPESDTGASVLELVKGTKKCEES